MPSRPARVGHGRDHEEIGERAVADEELLAGQAPAAAVAHRAGLDAGRVGAGPRLGEAHAEDALAAHGRQQPALALSASRAAAPRRRCRRRGGSGCRWCARTAPRPARVDRREAAAAVRGRHVHGVEAERLRLLEDGACLGGIELRPSVSTSRSSGSSSVRRSAARSRSAAVVPRSAQNPCRLTAPPDRDCTPSQLRPTCRWSGRDLCRRASLATEPWMESTRWGACG